MARSSRHRAPRLPARSLAADSTQQTSRFGDPLPSLAPSTLAGPKRIAPARPGWRRSQHLGLAAAAAGAGALITWLSQPASLAVAGLPDWPWAAPTRLVAPLLLAALALWALWRLGPWALVLLGGGVMLGAAPDLLSGRMTALNPPLLTALALLPALALLMRRGMLRRLGFSGRLRRGLDLQLFAGLAGLAVPLAATFVAWLLSQGSNPLLLLSDLALPWALGLMGLGSVLLTPTRASRQGPRWSRLGVALAALAAQAAASFSLLGPAVWLLPHLLLGLQTLQTSARRHASLGAALLLIWAAGPAPQPLLGLGLALIPLIALALTQPQQRDRDGWRTALDAQGFALAEWRFPEGALRASGRWLALTHLADTPAEGAPPSPLDWVRAAHPRDRDRVRRALRSLLSDPGRTQLALELRLAADGGDWRWHALQAHVARRDRLGQARSLITTLTDVSAAHTAAERERMTAALFQHVGDGLAVIDTHWRVLEVNPAYCELMRATREALIGRPAAPLTAAHLRSNGFEAGELQAALAAGREWRGSLQIDLEDGSRAILPAKLSPIPGAAEAGEAARWRLLSLSDQSETLRQRDLLRRSLRFDTATGLPNRDEFIRQLQAAQPAAQRDGVKLLVCLIDLDDFARVNAEHGQLVADAVLLQLSSRLQSALRTTPSSADQLARLHGDEFAVLLRVHTPEEGQRAVERLLNLLCTPVAVRESQVGDGLSLEISASLGATLYPQDDADPETLLRHAGHALYRAKRAGKGGIQFYDTTLGPRDEASLIALARLQQALDLGELRLHYQPQIDLRSGQVTGVEALLRWHHPERGLLSPAHFLPLVETTGLAVQLGDWVIEQALAQTATWLQAGLRLPVSVNVGARQLRRHDFPVRLQELLARQPPEVAAQLHLDVLEADALTETAAAQALIQRCLALGIGIALDDFGAGYSRLAALKQLHVDTLKLDRSYVQGMLGDAQDLSLVEGVIGLARTLGCAVLAKGVESRAHARELLRLGCRLGQGNGIAAAMPAADLPGWVAEFGRSDWAGLLRTQPAPTHPVD